MHVYVDIISSLCTFIWKLRSRPAQFRDTLLLLVLTPGYTDQNLQSYSSLDWQLLVFCQESLSCHNIYVILRMRCKQHRPAVALAIEEVRSLCTQVDKQLFAYESSEIRIPTKKIEKRMTQFKSTFTTGFIKRFSDFKCCSQAALRTFWSHLASQNCSTQQTL